jgi:hypothetical protein
LYLSINSSNSSSSILSIAEAFFHKNKEPAREVILHDDVSLHGIT